MKIAWILKCLVSKFLSVIRLPDRSLPVYGYLSKQIKVSTRKLSFRMNILNNKVLNAGQLDYVVDPRMIVYYGKKS